MSEEFPEGVQLEPPSGLSPSSLDTYLQCPLRFKFSKIDKIKEKSTEAQIVGTYAHEILEHLFMFKPEFREIEQAKALARSFWTIHWKEDALKVLGNESLLHGFQWKVWWAIEEYYKLEDPRTFEPSGLETKLDGFISDVPFRGIIDQTVDEGTNVVIRDYKTGKIPAAKYQAGKFKQLVIYKLLHEQNFGKPVDRVELIYLKTPGKIIAHTPSQDDVTEMEATASRVWDEIQVSCEIGKFEPKKSVLCKWCSYMNICPIWRR